MPLERLRVEFFDAAHVQLPGRIVASISIPRQRARADRGKRIPERERTRSVMTDQKKEYYLSIKINYIP